MKFLLTSVRLPHALGLIRHLGRAGHSVYATDTFRTSPGLHSKYVEEAILTSAPAFETRAFIGEIADVIRSRGIERLLPCFEDVFYIARHREELAALCEVFCPSFEVLAKLFDGLPGRSNLSQQSRGDRAVGLLRLHGAGRDLR